MQHPQNLIGPLKTVMGDGPAERAIDPPELISLEQAASVLRIPIDDVRTMMRQGHLAARDLDGTPYVTWASFKVVAGIE